MVGVAHAQQGPDHWLTACINPSLVHCVVQQKLRNLDAHIRFASAGRALNERNFLQ